jgi:uridine kinase
VTARDVSREELWIAMSALVLALPDDRVQTVAVDGMSGSGKTTLAAEVAVVVAGAGRPVVQVAYDDFHHPRERRHRQGRLSAEGYLEDAFDPDALRRAVLDPIAAGDGAIRTASYDLAADEPVDPEPTPVGPGSVVLVEGSFLLAADLAPAWDLALLVVADPDAVLERVLVRDADLGTPEQVRELYLRRYFGAWALHEERNDPWSRADAVVDLTDPLAPRLLG